MDPITKTLKVILLRLKLPIWSIKMILSIKKEFRLQSLIRPLHPFTTIELLYDYIRW